MPSVKRRYLSPQLSLFLISLTISFIGLLAVYNSSVVEGYHDFQDKYHFVKQQIIWLSLGILAFAISSRFPLNFVKRAAPLFFALSTLFMLLVIIPGVGLKLQGARRWINLGIFSFQPSEFFKLGLILYLAHWLEKIKNFNFFLLLTTLSIGLVMLQPDLGTAIVIGTSAFLVFYLSGAPLHKLTTMALIALAAGTVLIISSPYRLSRLHTFLDPTTDPLGSSYHINQILLSLGSGGWFGVGLGRSIQKHSYLPEATTDSIFAVIGEELGFTGATILVLLLLGLVLYGFKLAQQAKTPFAKLTAGGISCLLAVQTFVNLAAMVALVPLTGVPLPLISYGGSSLIATFTALGILASTSKDR